ncbi:beta-phosphoglucomutase [Bacillus bombysepticus]|uniref:Beta-phosphoglucomutase n=1 Tax=Bacillus thuringiensis serovar kumamotoensis TaxID=132267 RepID=A0A9X6JRC5_BACUK|nr:MULTISPECIES: beta-phosphoglucomutase [Bacillus cereus group]MEC2867332.1 beta-phosphoglucomutase [Bacillus cereus]OTZ75936.1 beta-phosphoglucomutase [Bacillus thuringiensis serovar kumamtoensis]
MTKKIEAFIFDLDGVITDTAEYHYLAWKKLGEDLGIPFDREFNETLKGVSRTESLERILKLRNRQHDFTLEEKIKLAMKKNAHYVDLIQHITAKDLLPGVEAFLQQIQQAGLKIAMASASKNALMVTNALGISPYFDYIVDANTVANSKPDPEVFLKAAEAVHVSPEFCVGVEDAAAGVEAINSANMFSVAIGDRDILGHANLVLSSTAELNLETIKEHAILVK